MAIPRIIHQTWKSAALPPAFRAFQATWQRLHPGWEYRFYDDGACRAVVAEGFPALLALYDAFPHPVQRADLFRYLVVARHGGLYADMDTECLKNCDPLLAGRGAVFGCEDHLSPGATRRLGLRHRERIANFLFAAEAGHPVFARIVARIQALPGPWDLAEEVLETTGPGMLTDVVQEERDRLGLTILPRICWAPPTFYPDCPPFTWHSFARHHFAGTWKQGSAPGLGPAGLREALRRLDPRELYYQLPPSPLWWSDLRFWERRGGAL
jgi:mannosyltransferase OCH1-like enzyme